VRFVAIALGPDLESRGIAAPEIYERLPGREFEVHVIADVAIEPNDLGGIVGNRPDPRVPGPHGRRDLGERRNRQKAESRNQ